MGADQNDRDQPAQEHEYSDGNTPCPGFHFVIPRSVNKKIGSAAADRLKRGRQPGRIVPADYFTGAAASAAPIDFGFAAPVVMTPASPRSEFRLEKIPRSNAHALVIR
jgi:hypothetical protein